MTLTIVQERPVSRRPLFRRLNYGLIAAIAVNAFLWWGTIEVGKRITNYLGMFA